jgi:predicted porin
MIGMVLAGGMAAAQADVQVFGHLDLSVDSYDDDCSGAGCDDVNLSSNTSSVGFKGSEDLGNGLKAIFKIDFGFDMANRQREITDRDQWLGLKGNFGQVRVGTISTGYKSHGALLDPMYKTSLQGRSHGLQSSRYHSGAGEDLEGRADNTFRYDSPNFNGLKVVGHYTLDSHEIDDAEDEDAYGIGASYENGGILVFADYMNEDGTVGAISPASVNDRSVWKVGGKYSLNNFAVMAQYEQEDLGSSADPNQWHVGGSYTMGNNLVYAAFGQRDPDTAGSDTLDAWTIAAMHSMSKRTKVYAGYNQEDTSNTTETDFFSVGMKHKF